MPSPLKSPTATEIVPLLAPKFAAAAKLANAHVAGVVTVSMNVFVALAPPLSKALTVTA